MLEDIKKLKEMTGAGIQDCKQALQESGGDLEKAVDVLRKKGLAKALKRANKEAKEGIIDSYIHHGGRLGVIVEVNCETDFVARNEEFKKFVHEISLHIAAMSPKWVRREDVPEEVIKKELEIYKEQSISEGKKPEIAEKIAQGKIEKFYQETCLLEQTFARDGKTKVGDLLKLTSAKFGENLVISRFARFELGGKN